MADLEQSAEELFAEALDREPECRAAFLEEACRDSPELRCQLEALLRKHEQLGSFLAEPLFSPGQSPQTTQTIVSMRGLAAGSKLGRYTIVEPLGAGGMGVVYRAQDEKLERAVAIKILGSGVFSGEDARRRFHKEARALAKLSHTHIAAVYDVGEQDGLDYIVMECVPGESLAGRLNSGPLTVKEATSIVLQIAQALEEAHEQGVIHRDLKPANVMMTPKGQAKVLDFGLAKLLSPLTTEPVVSLTQTGGIVGTPLYMSPEQAQGQTLDARTDLWNLGVLYYELLTGRSPFQADSSLAVLRAIAEQAPIPLRRVRPDAPALAEQIVARALEKDPGRRYQTAAEMIHDASELLSQLGRGTPEPQMPAKKISRVLYGTTTVALLLVIVVCGWFYYRSSRKRWAREEAIPQINALMAAHKPLTAFLLLEKAQQYLRSDPQLKQIADENSQAVSIASLPTGATIEIQDYAAPASSWLRLGATPLTHVRIPKGYFRWKVSRPGAGELVVAPPTETGMEFTLDDRQMLPSGMVRAAGGTWQKYIGFVGWVGPFKLPPYFLDRYEVTNRAYQDFVDSGGYEKREYWPEKFTEDGRELSWSEAMARFRDTTGRPGPSTWVGGHYPQGRGEYPVSGVSWFEASAYAAYAGKRLPLLAEWYQSAPPDLGAAITPWSNFSGTALAPVGAYKGLGPDGTYDMAGNVREWVMNAAGDKLRFILGGSWKSQPYLYADPEALPPFDRSAANGFRCVRNIEPPPKEAALPVKPLVRDFAKFRPVSDDVFRAYKILYEYPPSPLNAKVEGVIAETEDWREEKVSFDAGYGGQRMAAYLFLPRHVRPPYQTVLFFPSARVLLLDDSRKLGDMKFFDYIIQSGRAVMYPVYEDTYERRIKFDIPGGALSSTLNVDHYKDAARSLDYLATRPDIDGNRLAYLGVSMGSGKGVILATLLQDRLRTAIFLDGGYFLFPPPAGSDQADFAPRMKKPVLMVNGRYDFSFPMKTAQDPLFAMLGTPNGNKRHVVLDTPHDVTQQRPQLIKVVLDWLDQYLGRVNE